MVPPRGAHEGGSYSDCVGGGLWDHSAWSSWILLLISKPGQIAAVELDVFSSDGEGIVFRVSWVDRDLGCLNLGDDMEGSIVRSNAKGDGKLATSSGRMHGKSSVAGGNEDGSFRSEPGWSKVLASAEVSK